LNIHGVSSALVLELRQTYKVFENLIGLNI